MVTCPWCGTSYAVFQSSCSQCGGPLHPPVEVEAAGEAPLEPPSAPRQISNAYVFKLMGSDGLAIMGLVFSLFGIIFTPLGLGLTVALVTAFVGIPFLLLGVAFLIAGVAVLVWRYRKCQQQVEVLKRGEAVLGSITGLEENQSVEVNGRHPWSIAYQYQTNGQVHTGAVTTLNPPGSKLQPGRGVYVLYMVDEPTLSTLYPHP